LTQRFFEQRCEVNPAALEGLKSTNSIGLQRVATDGRVESGKDSCPDFWLAADHPFEANVQVVLPLSGCVAKGWFSSGDVRPR